MLAGPHMAVGALIGRTSGRAWVALPLAFASHYALDALPHAYLSLRDPAMLPLKATIVAVDALVGVTLVAWMARRQRGWRLILGSAFAATLLDLMNPVSSPGRWLGSAPVARWLIAAHFACAWHVPFGRQWGLGFGPSVGVLAAAAVAAWLLLRAEPRRARGTRSGPSTASLL
jgi:hypothetical protein